MGCNQSKSQSNAQEGQAQKIRKKEKRGGDDKFWVDSTLKDDSGEQTIASVENINYFYTFQRKLGSGSFGTVSLASKVKEPNKRVAIKTIGREQLDLASQVYIKREVDIIKRLDHPNICQFLEAYIDKRNIYIVMEYCGGGTLKELIYSQMNNEQNVAKIMQKLLWAVNYMHNSNIIHRDLKLENILFGSQNKADLNVKIIDFGLSKIMDKEKRRQTKVGSFNYMAPEVLFSSYYGKECDVWSLGCIAFALIGSEYAFNDIESIQKGQFTFGGSGWRLVSRDARDLIEKMLVVNPKKRITIEMAMKHSWFKKLRKNTLATNVLPTQRMSKQIQISKLFSTSHASTFKREVLHVIVKQMDDRENMTPKMIFKLLDKKSNGYILESDLQEVVKKLNIWPDTFKDAQDIKELVTEVLQPEPELSNSQPMKYEKDKHINYADFLAKTLDEQYYLSPENLMRAFNYFDASETQSITKEDFIDVLARKGRRLPTEEVESIYKEIGPFLDLNGDLSFSAFSDLMRQGSKQAHQEKYEQEVILSESNESGSELSCGEEVSKPIQIHNTANYAHKTLAS